MSLSELRRLGEGRFNFLREERRSLVVFVPGLVLVLMGLAALLFPRLLMALFALFLISIGAVMALVAWKVVQLKRKFEEAWRGSPHRVVIQTVALPDGFGLEEEPLDYDVEGKKIILH